jgi:hypothetical protein
LSQKLNFSEIIAHETTHEKQFTKTYNSGVSAGVERVRELRKAPVANRDEPRGIFHQTTQLPIVEIKKNHNHESNSYRTDPLEISAYGVQAAYMQHEWSGASTQPKPPGKSGDRSVVLGMLSQISGALIDDAKPAEEHQTDLSYEDVVYTAEFTPEHTPAYQTTGHILLHLADLEKMQASCKSEEVANAVHNVIVSLKNQLPENRVINPTQDLKTVEAGLQAALCQLREIHGTQLMVPAEVAVAAQNTEHFNDLQSQPLKHAKIQAVQHRENIRYEIDVNAAHVDSVLENSGFNRAFDKLNTTLKSDKNLKPEQLLKPIMALAQYLASAEKNDTITAPAVNVYEALQTTVPHVEGLNNHAAQKVKIRLDLSCNMIHVPRHCLDNLIDSPGILAKIGLQVVDAQAFFKDAPEAHANLFDPGLFSKILLEPKRKFQKLKELIKKDHTAVQVISPSDDLARQIFASMVGTSQQYKLTPQGSFAYFNYCGDSYIGPQKPSETNHWHTYGDRALAKSIMADTTQSESTRGAAALAYKAGVVKRRAQEPFSAVQREFALRANARVVSAAEA